MAYAVLGSAQKKLVQLEDLQIQRFSLSQFFQFARRGGVPRFRVPHRCENMKFPARERFRNQPPEAAAGAGD